VNSDYARTRGIEVEYRKRIGQWFNGVISGSYSVATGKSSSEDEGILAVQGIMEEMMNETFLSWDRPVQLSASLSVFDPQEYGIFGFGKGVLDDFQAYFRIFFESGKDTLPTISPAHTRRTVSRCMPPISTTSTASSRQTGSGSISISQSTLLSPELI